LIQKNTIVFCPLCRGDGKLAKTPEGFEVCKECGSFGLTKKKGEQSMMAYELYCFDKTAEVGRTCK
jgi:hypothetical protein